MRFFLHTPSIHDDEGFESQTIVSAQAEAGRHVAEIITDDPAAIWDADWQIILADHRGQTLAIVHVVGTLAPALQRR